MSNFPYKNPLSSVQAVGVTTVPRSATFGTTYSVNNTGGYMEVYSLSDLIYTIPTGTTGSIEYSGNTIPIDFIKGTGNAWSSDVLTLGSDNISSGRRRLGMLVYVYEEDQVYQFHISGYTSLFTAATASTNCVVISDFGTTVKNNTVAGQNFINAWTASTIEDISGYTTDNATWRKFNTGTGGGGSGFTSVRINNVSQFTSSSNSYINFSGVNLTISSVGTNTLVLSAGTGGGGGSSNLQYFITGSTPSGVTINSGDRWFDTNTGVEVVYINDGDSSQWVRPSNGMVPLFTGNTSATCITSLYVSNIYGCSPININDLVIANSGITTTSLTATTISATTYLNLPSITGLYLPLSGGTMTGGLVANSGVTANTISQTSYIDFKTGSTNPSSVAGRLFFDATQKSLSYFDIANNQVPIAIGQQLYTRVWNATGVQIDKGKVIAITGTSNSLPSAILAVNNHAPGSARPVGVAAENIPNGSEGLVLNNGILSGLTLNTFANGDTLYLSDTIPGGYVSSTSSLVFSARTNEIGYVIQTGTTTGKLYVNINNEDSNLTLTDIERNILEGNVISSGVYEYTGMTIGTGATINVAQARGWIVRNTYEFATLPDVINLYYSGGTNIPLTYLTTADSTFILINSASTLVQQTTFPTPQQRRENIFLGKVVHPSRTSITSINQTVDFDVSPMAALRDLWTPLKLINQGIIVSPHSTTLEIDTSAGTLWGNGIGWITNQQNPDSVAISGTSPTTFQYRTQLGPLTGGSVTTGNTTTIAPGYYDLNGVVTAVGGGSNSSTNQRVYLFPTGLIRIQLGQTVYGTLAEAVAGSQSEPFIEYSLNRENGILIGIISVNKSASNLSDTAQAIFNFVSKFGEVLGGTGGISTTTLQQAYDNSTEPEILINSTLNGVSIRNGTGGADNVTSLLQGQNTAGTTTSFIRADGAFSGTSIFGTGVSATTISATTYQNLPTDIRTTGATYSNNTFTFNSNGTGSTYSVLFNTVTGLTVNGNLTITGITSSPTFTGGSITLSNSASTISLNNTTRQQIRFFSGGIGAPTYNTYSAGAKIILSDNIDSISSGYAIGVDSGSLWYGADLAGNGHDWYAGTRKLMSLAGASGLELVGLGGPTTTTMTISGTSVLGSKGGVGYIDFLKVVNNFSGATNPNKWFRVNSTGGLEIVNSAYNSTLLSLSDSGNLSVAGTVTANAWSAGQVIKDTILSNTEVTVSTTTIATSNADTDFVTYSYTPTSSNSYLIIHYHLASYDFTSGTGNDSYFSRIKVDGGEITFGAQSTVNGFRTGVLFPLTGRYTNSNTTAKSIVVACRRNSADDSISIVNSSTSMWLRITEIAR